MKEFVCERNCANLPFVQTCNRRCLCGASRSVSPSRKKTRIPSANIKSTATTKRGRANCNLSLGRTTEHYVCGSVLIRSDGKTFKMWFTPTHTWDKKSLSKMNARLWMLHARLHQLPDTEQISISTSVHPCKDPRQHSRWIQTWGC